MSASIRTSFHEQYLFYRHLADLEAHPAASDERSRRMQDLCNDFTNEHLEFVPASKAVAPTIQAMANNELPGLTNASIPQLAEMLRRQENRMFREQLATFTTDLGDDTPEERARLVRELQTGIGVLVQQHQRELEDIVARYDRKYLGPALIIGTGLVGALPVLQPFISPLLANPPLVLAGAGAATFTLQRISKSFAQSAAKRSLIGLLAADEPTAIDL